MDDLERIRGALLALGHSAWAHLSDVSGVPLSTVRKFAYGHVQRPTYQTVRSIQRVIEDEARSDRTKKSRRTKAAA